MSGLPRRMFLVIAAALLTAIPVSQGRAQDVTVPAGTPAGGRPPGRELLLQAAVGSLPEAPASIRLSRVSAAPGGAAAEAGRAGPMFIVIETGRFAVTLAGPAILLPAGEAGEAASVSGSVNLGPGDRLALPAGTGYTIGNEGTAPAMALTATILPAAATPPADVSDTGVTIQPLGEGVAASLPADRAAVTLERFVLAAGLGVPAYPGPVLVAVEAGGFASTLDSGDIQLSPGGQPGARPTVAPGESFELETGDAVFFPDGMQATPPLTGEAPLTLLRLGLLPLPPAAAGTPSASLDDAIAAGSIVVVTAPGLRLRAAARTDGEILAELAAGQPLVVTGPPVESSGLSWYPVQDPSNPAVTGFVAAEFVAPLD